MDIGKHFFSSPFISPLSTLENIFLSSFFFSSLFSFHELFMITTNDDGNNTKKNSLRQYFLVYFVVRVLRLLSTTTKIFMNFFSRLKNILSTLNENLTSAALSTMLSDSRSTSMKLREKTDSFSYVRWQPK